jgi:hypothetical protein
VVVNACGRFYSWYFLVAHKHIKFCQICMVPYGIKMTYTGTGTVLLCPVFRIRYLGSGAVLTAGSGSGIWNGGLRIRDEHLGSHFRVKLFFGLKILRFCDADPDPGLTRDPGSGIDKFGSGKRY